ncbi:MAG: hypothetical protein MI785_17415 [Kiloniellales bacterium]|nr:hypothetical protein [Kiloniellales bacterium]
MPLVADRVFETTTTQGTGTLSLAGAQSGFRAFRDAFANGDEVFYLIEQVDTAWEVGRGVFTLGTPDTLSRAQVLSSSAGGGAIGFGPGAKNVVAVTPGAELNQLLNNTPRLDRPNTYTDRQVILGSGEATLNVLGDSFVSPSIESYRNSASDHGMVLFKSARGTRAAPADLNDGDRILTLSPRPRIGGIFSGISSLWAILRDAKSAVEWRFFNGGVVVGSPAGGYRGAGTVNVQSRIDINGVPALPGAGPAEVALSGSAVSFTGLPTSARWHRLMLDRVSMSTLASLLLEIGDSGGFETAGYVGLVQDTSNTTGQSAFASAFGLTTLSSAGLSATGRVDLTLMDAATNKWHCHAVITQGTGSLPDVSNGVKVLSGQLDRLNLRASAGNFDAGSASVLSFF